MSIRLSSLAGALATDSNLLANITSSSISSNVGIHQTNPQFTLDVGGTVNASGLLTAAGATLTGSVIAPSVFFGSLAASNVTASNATLVGTLTAPAASITTLTGSVVGNVSGSAGTCTGLAQTAVTASNVQGGTVAATTIAASGLITANAGVTSSSITSKTGSGLTYNAPATFTHSWYTSNVNTLSLDASGNLTAAANVSAYSDARLKTDMTRITDSLSKIEKISGYTYKRNDLGDAFSNTTFAGVIAQEVHAILPEVIQTDANGFMSVSYGNMVSLLIEGDQGLEGSRGITRC